MSSPLFLIQIVDAETGKVLQLPGGGPLERDLIATCADAITKRGVGVFKSEGQVKKAIIAGITEAIRTIKWDTRTLVR